MNSKSKGFIQEFLAFSYAAILSCGRFVATFFFVSRLPESVVASKLPNVSSGAKKNGFTLVEVMVVLLIFTIIAAAGNLLFMAGESSWMMTDAHIRIRSNAGRVLQRIAGELQESGRDSVGTLQVSISDGAGTGGTDILIFTVPVCPCGVSAIDASGDVRYWGGPLSWGQSGCNDDYTVDAYGQVTICHAADSTTMSVDPNAVKAHLAEGDWLGACGDCTPAGYTNRSVEYRLGGNNRLLRSVLNAGAATVSETTVATNVTDFQAALNAGQTAVTITVTLTATALQNRQVAETKSMTVVLRNGG